MSKRLRRVLFALIILPLIVFVVGCPKKPPPEPATTTPPATSGTAPSGEEVKEQPFAQPTGGEESSLDAMSDEIRRLNEQKPLGTVYFDLDKSDLREDALEVLRRNAEWLKSHAVYQVRIEGNCDERGTTEYNLALGDRRASSVKSYLVKAGIDAGRFETISYGEEHPVDMGHDDSAWQKNRRADFTITGKTSR
jgi:peptidoglycan-associated lipoprotein